ncbi:hypothetical protein POM88_044532 [Heracleum sosnowskyi]|uniref:PTEN2A/B C2 domain-containing protein n=1 Tax=Heracleum sosnowskyi TaxID=360622 RepID=A0AAD8H5E0_9APIA|nr:hypothetical protein POM88_044532 [Heracleum sosnowskyi]
MTKVRDFTETIWKRWTSSLKPITRIDTKYTIFVLRGCMIHPFLKARGLRLHRCPYWVRPSITISDHNGVLFSTRRHPRTKNLSVMDQTGLEVDADDDEDDEDEENGEDQVDSDDDEAAADGDEAVT